MKSRVTLLKGFLAVSVLALTLSAYGGTGNTSHAVSVPVPALPGNSLLFTENRGQVTGTDGKVLPEVLFTAHSKGALVMLTRDGIRYQFTKTDSDRVQTHRLDVSLVAGNTTAHVRMEQPGALKENFYLPHCPQGITGVPTFGRIVYEEIYPGIDWVVYSKGNELEYDFVVKPGADPSQIRLKIRNAGKATINRSGQLEMQTSLGTITEQAPLSFAAGKKVPSRFVQYGDHTFGFSVTYDAKNTLVIDPTVQWSSYFGGSNLEVSRASAADANGNVYVSGWTNSTAGVGSSGQQTTYGGGNYDAFLVKMDANGTLKWATYYGGSGTDYGYACAVNNTGNAVYLAGTCSSTTSGSIATTGSHQATNGGSNDAFLVKFDSNGVRQWGTYYGGTASDYGYGCAVDGGDNVYLAGYTGSAASIASANGVQTTLGSANDAFLVKFNASGVRQWGTYYGGTAEDRAFACTAYGSKIYITGYTASTADFTTAGTFQSTFAGGSYDMFAVQFDSSGARNWATYYGGTGSDYSYGCAAYSGGVYLSGYTSSSTATLASDSAYQAVTGGGYESILARLDLTGNRLWGTFFGGAGSEFTYGCSVSPQGDIYLSGYSTSTAAIASGGFQNTNAGSTDAFIAKFRNSGSLLWSSYYGSSSADTSFTCAAVNGGVFLPGHTASTTGIATSGAYQTAFAGVQDAFILKVSDPVVVTGTLVSNTLCTGVNINVPFSAYGAFNSGNTFTAQLSGATGSFTTPLTIGTATSNTGVISAVIPAGTAAGAGYRIRIVASSPALTAEDNGANLTIAATPAAPLAITGANNTCGGSPETYYVPATATATSYTWTVPASWTGASVTDTLHAVSGITGGSITVTANNACGSSSATTLTVTISAAVAPGAVVSATDTTICEGIPVTFSAVALNGGTAPSYQWMKNGLAVGMNSSSYTDAAIADNDSVYVIITSSSLCVDTPDAESNKIYMQLNPLMNPAVTVTPDPGTAVPANQTVTFTATTANAGTSPVYQWYVGGTAIVGATNNTFTVTGLLDGDSVNVLVIADNVNSDYCTTTDSVLSDALIMDVTPDDPPPSTGITSTAGFKGLLLYPNPTNGLLYLDAKNSKALAAAGHVRILNAVGQLIQEVVIEKGDNAIITLRSALPNGLYFLRLQSGSDSGVWPFTLTR